MTTSNPHDDQDQQEDRGTWEQGETQELSMREVSFRRQPPAKGSAPQAPDDAPGVSEPTLPAAPEPQDDELAAGVDEPEEKVPFYKREISLRRRREPDRGAGARTAAGTTATPAPRPPASEDDEPEPETVRQVNEPGPTPFTAFGKGRSGSGQPTVGVKIGQHAISVAVVVQRGGVGELTQLVRRELDPGIVADGEVRSVSALAQVLGALWTDESLPRHGVRLGLFGNRVGVRSVDIAGVEEAEQFANAVRFKAHEVLPIGVQETVLDYRVLGERLLESGELVRHTLLVVAPRDQVMPYVEAFRTARIGLEAVDIDALALLRAFVDPGQPGLAVPQDSAAVVVSMEREGSTLLVSGAGMCEFTRAFEWGGTILASAVAEQLDLTLDQAWSALESLARHGATNTPLEDDRERQAADTVRARIVPFARELVSSLQFYQQQLGSLGIADIVLTGTLAHVPGVAEALHQLIGVTMRVGDPTARLVVHAPVAEGVLATPGSMAVPIGLAVSDRPERTVDLIPPDQRVKIRWRPRLAPVLLPAAAAIPLAVVGFAFLQAASTVSDREARLDAAEAELAALPEPNASIDPALTGEAGQRAESVASLLGQRVAWNATLSDLSRVLPADVWLSSVSAKLPDPSLTAVATTPGLSGPTSVEIAGKAIDYASLAQALTRLSTVPSLSDVQLFNSTTEEIGLPSGKKVKVVSFQISANVDTAGGS